MQLKKEPETEIEYWTAIQALDGFIWGLRHDLADGRIGDSCGEIDREINKAKEMLTDLISGLSYKFGVIPPQECPQVEFGKDVPPAPENMIYFGDWYEKMKKIVYEIEYNKIICSSCPFSTGAENMRSIPCNVFPGVICQLENPYTCGMITSAMWTEDELFSQISEVGGPDTLVRFKNKLAELSEEQKR